jgi:hypothetical protein
MNLLFVLNLIFFAFSCQQETDQDMPSCCLTSEDSLSIIKEIIAVTDDWVEANINMDAEKFIKQEDS